MVPGGSCRAPRRRPIPDQPSIQDDEPSNPSTRYARAVRWLAIVALLSACASVPAARPAPVDPIDPRCRLPAPTILRRDGSAVLARWDVPDDPRWSAPVIPDDPRYLAYRRAIRDAGADLARPIADAQRADTEELRELWRREHANADLVYGGTGRVRRIHCLDAAVFAYQHARHDQLVQPTELLAMVLRKSVGGRGMLRIYFGASDVLFPPKSVYGLDHAARDVADGWRLAVHLHNHTIVKRGGRPALGTPAPSTSDVGLLRNVAADLGLASVWVTNGIYTAEVPAAALARFHTRD